MDTYDAIWANSRFTQKWIARYWDRDSHVLYPPVDVECFHAADKRKQILSVGRFFAGSHNKKHQVMIAAFKEMVDQGLTDWTLHLAGGRTPGDEHAEYLRQVSADVQGYPILIHPDISFDDLFALYGASAIYWHAGGFGEDENSDPIKFEHFGLTTVEAMASGCAPVVIAKGGQPEIVKHQHNGFLWETTAELESFTWQLIRDDGLRARIARAAMQDCRLYDKAHFRSRLQELLAQIGLEV
jgi:glycosyltransferase involved in cell wall biosynthesis